MFAKTKQGSAWVAGTLLMLSACGGAPPSTTPDSKSTEALTQPATTEHAEVENALAAARAGKRDALGVRRYLVLPDWVRIDGRSVTQWTEQWWRYLSSVPAAQSPELVLDEDCGVDNHQGVFFIPPYHATVYQRRCRVPFGKPVLFTVQAVLNSYPCPDPSFKPAPGQTLESFLTEGAVGFNDAVTELTATLDGAPLTLTHHRDTSPLFTNDVDPSLLSGLGDPCLTGSPQPAVSDGWFMLTLLAPGSHVLHVTAVNPDGSPTNITTTLDVR